jgi:hypothetical protein
MWVITDLKGVIRFTHVFTTYEQAEIFISGYLNVDYDILRNEYLIVKR